MTQYKAATLYTFTPLSNLETLQSHLQSICKELTGTLLIASEGINGTIAGLPNALDTAMHEIQAIPAFNNLWHQYSGADRKPFRRLKIRIKKEIVTMAQPNVSPLVVSGSRVPFTEWNALLDQTAVVVDVRNDYEYRIGTFQKAVNPQTTYFSAFPAFVDQKLIAYKEHPIALFCTGGIRCEKASSYMLTRGFKEVYQLHGGILHYLKNVPASESRWQGECFVFDDRVSLTHGLQPGSCSICYGCRMPLRPEDCKKRYQPGVHCIYCQKPTQ